MECEDCSVTAAGVQVGGEVRASPPHGPWRRSPALWVWASVLIREGQGEESGRAGDAFPWRSQGDPATAPPWQRHLCPRLGGGSPGGVRRDSDCGVPWCLKVPRRKLAPSSHASWPAQGSAARVAPAQAAFSPGVSLGTLPAGPVSLVTAVAPVPAPVPRPPGAGGAGVSLRTCPDASSHEPDKNSIDGDKEELLESPGRR